MYKIRMRSRRGREVNPVGEEVTFEDVGYTSDPEVANYYKDRFELIAIEEIEDQE